MSQRPPMDPQTDEASREQLDAARAQGEALRQAIDLMTNKVAHDGGMKEAGEYIVGYAVEEAEGMYVWSDGGLQWKEAEDANLHLEVVVCDASDGRFVPGLGITATLETKDGEEVGTNEQPLLWHPMLYHYGRNWTVPGDGQYRLRVVVDPPTFARHDKVNGRRFTERVTVEFESVDVKTGQG